MRESFSDAAGLLAWARVGNFKGEGPTGLKQYLVANREKFTRGFSEKLLTYALGRRQVLTDENELTGIRAIAERDNFRFQALILAFVEFKLFQTR